MTKKYKFQQIREAHNEFEAFLRIKGMSTRQFSFLLDISEVTARRYILDTTLLRYYHMRIISDHFNMSVKDVIDIIEYDLK
jgi:hypothetical protein|tara:strand:- start:1485 stop:1727 length:243 start_codon:yes stop_codon:yes gene_type:complete